MKTKITEEMTAVGYSIAQDVYSGKMRNEDALDYLESECKMNRNSASDYIRQIRCLMNGDKFTRSNSRYAFEYFFEKIFADYGEEKKRNALNSLSEHILYQKTLKRGNYKTAGDIYEKYSLRLNEKQ